MRCIVYSDDRFGHPQRDRTMSMRETGFLQTFPIDFTGNLNSYAAQIGDAVPVILAQRFGEPITAHRNELSKNGNHSSK